MFQSLKNLLYTQMYINIIANKKETIVYVQEVSSKNSFTSDKQVFDSSKKNDINEYIKSYVKKTPINYISILDNSTSCGAVPSCTKEKNLYYNSDDYENICVSKEWTYYTSKANLLELQRSYSKVGIDFVFSPFLILANFFKDKISNDVAMYVLVNDDHLNISIFENSKLLFSSNTNLDSKNINNNDDLSMDEDDEELVFDDDVGINLEDVSVEDSLDSTEEFADIEELDTFDEMEEFSDDNLDDSSESAESQDFDLDRQGGFGVDFQRFSLIQSAVKNFYNDDKFDSKFIEVAYIADAIGLGNELKNFLEEEMFLSVYIRKMDLAKEICELAKAEPK